MTGTLDVGRVEHETRPLHQRGRGEHLVEIEGSMEAEVTAVRRWANTFESEVARNPLRRPDEPCLLKLRTILAAKQVVVSVGRDRIFCLIVVDVAQQTSAANFKTKIADVLAVAIPPRASDTIVVQIFIPPHRGVPDESIPLDT